MPAIGVTIAEIAFTTSLVQLQAVLDARGNNALDYHTRLLQLYCSDAKQMALSIIGCRQSVHVVSSQIVCHVCFSWMSMSTGNEHELLTDNAEQLSSVLAPLYTV